MLRPKAEEIRHGGVVGKCFAAGFLFGAGLELLGRRRTSYSSYFGVRMGVAGCCLYLAGRAVEACRRLGRR